MTNFILVYNTYKDPLFGYQIPIAHIHTSNIKQTVQVVFTYLCLDITKTTKEKAAMILTSSKGVMRGVGEKRKGKNNLVIF